MLESIELNNTRVTLQDANLVPFGSSAPLRAADVAVIEGEGVAAACRFPAEASLGEPALAALLGEIEVDAIKALAAQNFVSNQ